METTHNLIGTAEAARILDRSHRTVHRLVESGELVPVLTAPGGYKGTFLFDRSHLEQIKAKRDAGAAA